MAIAMIYDTLKLAEQLEQEAGFDAQRARAMARILAENTGGNVATREDLRDLATKGDLQAVKEQIQDIRGDIRVLYWMTGTTLAGVAAILSLAVTLALHVMHLD
jgi:hypothetical protein